MKQLVKKILKFVGLNTVPQTVFDAIVDDLQRKRIAASKNPLNKFGMRSFSQSDEDGITMEIMRRLEIENGTYCEYGVGDGLECNTLVLASLGWSGFWISGQDIAFSTEGIAESKFRFLKTWVTSKNVVSQYQEGLASMNKDAVDVLSFDLDYNDLYFVQLLLESIERPKLYIVEYNAKFIPPARWCVEIDDDQMWSRTDYTGASLQSFIDLFEKFNYTLICCNAATGSNAFFIDNAYLDKFPDVPSDIIDIFQTPSYNMHRLYGHVPDPRTVHQMLKSNN